MKKYSKFRKEGLDPKMGCPVGKPEPPCHGYYHLRTHHSAHSCGLHSTGDILFLRMKRRQRVAIWREKISSKNHSNVSSDVRSSSGAGSKRGIIQTGQNRLYDEPFLF